MKTKKLGRIIAVTLIVITLLTLVGCGGKKPSFKSVYDTVNKKNITLGDSRKSIDKLLGDPEYDEKFKYYYYLNDLVSIVYDDSDKLIYIDVSGDSDRFVFKDISFQTKRGDLLANFEVESGRNGTYQFFDKYYTKNGKDGTKDKYDYCTTVFAKGNDSDFEIRSISIGTAEEE